MLSGKQAFGGESASEMLAAVLKLDPDWGALPPSTPASVKQLVGRCLTKDRKQRLQAIGEARITIELALSGATQEPEAIPGIPRGKYNYLPWALAGALFVALSVLSFLQFNATPPDGGVVTTTILPPAGVVFDFITTPNSPAISPDGRQLVFGARSADGKTQLWIRSMDSSTAQPLAGTESARFPFWSPDSKSLGFFAGGKLKTIAVAGGPPLTLADAPTGHGGTWSPEGMILFSPSEGGPLERVAASGGAASPATTPDSAKEGSHRFPWFLPDGRHFLFENLQPGSYDANIQVASLDSSEAKTVVRARSNVVYAGGRLLFLREDTLMAQPFDAKRLVTTGGAVPVAEQVGHALGHAVGLFSASRNGLLVYQVASKGGMGKLTWIDRSGKSSGTLAESADFANVEFSPAQKALAAAVDDTISNRDLWIYDVERGLRTRFTFDPATDDHPVWSPDGRTIAFGSNRKGHFDLYRKSSDGTGAEELLYGDNLDKAPGSWSTDGKFLAYYALDPKTSYDIYVLPLTQGGAAPKPFLFLQTGFRELRPQFSPDGRWIAYESDESQQYEIYVAPFPGPGGKRQISTSGGTRPRWRRDGKEIFFVGPDGRLMAAGVNLNGNAIEVGQVRSLGIPVNGPTGNYQYDVSADGQRFLVAVAPEQNGSPPLTLVENWAAGLRK